MLNLRGAAIPIAALLVAVPLAHAASSSMSLERRGGTLSRLVSSSSDLANLVIVTEDGKPVGNESDGCESISIHDYRTRRMLHAGANHYSPGRIAVRGDLAIIAANSASGCGWKDPQPGGREREPNPACDPWLALMVSLQHDLSGWQSGVAVGNDIATKAGIAFNHDGDLLVATGAGAHDRFTIIPARPPYGIARHEQSLSGPRFRRLSSPAAARSLGSLVGEILPSSAPTRTYLVTLAGLVHSVHSTSLTDLGEPIAFPTPRSRPNAKSNTMPPVEAFHASYSSTYEAIAIGGMEGADVILVDLLTRTSERMPLPEGVEYVGGIAFNNAWANEGLLAVHAVDRLLLLAKTTEASFGVIDEIEIKPPHNFRDEAVTSGAGGPLLALEWTADGAALIAASDVGHAEFAVVSVDPERRVMSIAGGLRACLGSPNEANDIWTANGLLTPPASPTVVATASATPTRTPSPTRTDEPTATATPTPTATTMPSATASPSPVPAPIYLPLALSESCDPTQVRIDVALVIDASSSMSEPAAPGSAQTKLDTARVAVGAFLDVLALDEGDQAAIVSFHHDAWLQAALTADRAELETALAAVETGQQTRIDRGLEVATAALLDESAREPDNEPVLVLLTDGRANPVPVEVAEVRAAEAKAAGITVFTIGLGEEAEAEALRRMATEPDSFLRAPTAAELAAAYREVARRIPCPAGAYWGRR